ncbi:hypothetical protein AVEN_40706-1 [Araneus ventricosus]|uniref:RNase H type-1 domain-containing protein n=1 Tax=Araneus ventricosus TaxID=182803 RepID=A0A4Y1ZJS3_ARAVE|nr:hypothetical protein AVEN_40706-1 [Araneus ventricosus]
MSVFSTTKSSHYTANFDLEDRVSIVSDSHPPAETIYTDSSHLEVETGYVFCVSQNNVQTHQWAGKLSPHNTVFQAETLTIKEAINWLILREYQHQSGVTASRHSEQFLPSKVQIHWSKKHNKPSFRTHQCILTGLRRMLVSSVTRQQTTLPNKLLKKELASIFRPRNVI